MAVATQASFIAAGTARHWDSVGDTTVFFPPGIERGDLIVMHVRANNNTAAEAWDPGAAGWRRRAQFQNYSWVYTRLADGTESGSQTIQFTTTEAKSARIYLFRGPRGDRLIDLDVVSGDNNTITHQDVRAHASGRLAVALVSYGGLAGGASAFGGESGGNWTEQAEASSGAGGNRTIQLQTAQMTAATLSGGSYSPGTLGTWVTHTFAIASASASESVRLRVKVEDPDGVMRDLGSLVGQDWQISASYEHDIDAPVSSATVRLWRSNSLTESLAPLVTSSVLNRDAALAYAPLLHASRRITIETAVIEGGGSDPLEEEWQVEFDGVIDRVDSGGGLFVEVAARDQGAILQTEWVKQVTTYGDDGGTKTAHDVIQDILNDWATTPPTLFVPTAPVPPVLIHEYEQQKMSVMDAIKAVATGHGWDVRYLLDEITGQWRLTYFEPRRETTELDGAFSAADYTVINSLAIGVEDIRNDGSVIYTDGTTGQPAQVTVSDPVSIAKWGGLHRFFEFEFGPDSPIDSADEANALLAGALSDLSDPFAEQEVQMPYSPHVTIGRLYEFLPNDQQYDEAQRFAPSRVLHELSAEGSTTTAFMRGKVAGQFKAWLRNEAGTEPRDGVDGLTTEFRFICAQTQPATPIGEDPFGWTLQPPTCSLQSVLWQSSVQRNARTGLTVGPWTTPVRVTGPEGEQGDPGPPGADGTTGPSIPRIWHFPSPTSADVLIQVDHSEGLSGLLEVWVNPSGPTSPDPEAPADGSIAVSGPYPRIFDEDSIFNVGGVGTRLLNDVPAAMGNPKTIFARFTDSNGRVATAQHILSGIIEVIDPFGILRSADPLGLVENLALDLVTNPNLAEGAVAFRNLVVGSYDNLISDPGFEGAGKVWDAGGNGADALTQVGWSSRTDAGGTWRPTSSNQFAGDYCCIYLRSGQTGEANLSCGGNTGADVIKAEEDDQHYFQTRARQQGSGSGSQARISVAYRNAAGTILAQHFSDTVNLTFSYQTIALETAPAPPGTATVQFRLRVLDSGTNSGVLFDECFARLKIDGRLVVDGSIIAKHIAAGSITTPLLAARAAAFEKVSIGSLGNMIPDPGFESSGQQVPPSDLGSSTSLQYTDWTVDTDGGGTWSIVALTARTGRFALNFSTTGQTATAIIKHVPGGMDCNPGEQFHFAAWFRGTGSGGGTDAGVSIAFLDEDDNFVGAAGDFAGIPVGTYVERAVSAVAPAGAVHVLFQLVVINDGTTQTIRIDDCRAQRKIDTPLYVDGSIVARHLAALTIEVGKFIESSNYVAGSSGWRIDGDGNLEANDGTFRGTVAASAVIASGNFTTDEVIISGGGGGSFSIDLTTAGVAVINAASNQLLIQHDSTSDMEINSLQSRINLNAADGVRVNFPGLGIRELVVDGINTADVGFRNVRVAN